MSRTTSATGGVPQARRGDASPGPATTAGATLRPAISFLCPAYKTEAYLPGTIASVLAQTRPDWELVVVDNGMSDAIRDIVLAAGDPRIVLVRQENKGFAGGVAAAVAAASGRYFSQLNSDDQVLEGFVERMAGLLDNHPDVDAVTCDALVLEERTNSYRRQSFHQQHGVKTPVRFTDRLTLPELIDGKVIYYTAAVRREAWDRVGGLDGLGDVPMYLRLLREGADIRMIPDRLGVYMYRDDSLSRNPESIAAFQAFQEQAYLDGAAGSPDPEVHEALARRLRRLRYYESLRHAREALLAGDAERARTKADEAVAMRRTSRSLAVAAIVRTSPHAVSRLWPLKQEVTRSAKRAVASLRGAARS